MGIVEMASTARAAMIRPIFADYLAKYHAVGVSINISTKYPLYLTVLLDSICLRTQKRPTNYTR